MAAAMARHVQRMVASPTRPRYDAQRLIRGTGQNYVQATQKHKQQLLQMQRPVLPARSASNPRYIERLGGEPVSGACASTVLRTLF
jgi:hypothetical protein